MLCQKSPERHPIGEDAIDGQKAPTGHTTQMLPSGEYFPETHAEQLDTAGLRAKVYPAIFDMGREELPPIVMTIPVDTSTRLIPA